MSRIEPWTETSPRVRIRYFNDTVVAAVFDQSWGAYSMSGEIVDFGRCDSIDDGMNKADEVLIKMGLLKAPNTTSTFQDVYNQVRGDNPIPLNPAVDEDLREYIEIVDEAWFRFRDEGLSFEEDMDYPDPFAETWPNSRHFCPVARYIPGLPYLVPAEKFNSRERYGGFHAEIIVLLEYRRIAGESCR